jgi:hypothetical protein
MNSNINDVIESIGKKVVVITNDLDEIRELLKELKQTDNNININTTIQNEDSDNLPPSDENYIYDENYNSSFNNLGSESVLESGFGSGTNAKSNVTNVPTLPLVKKFDVNIEYTPIQIQNYHDLASNGASSEELKPDEKYNIIVNAEKRREYLKRKDKTEDEQKEFQKLNEIFETCEKNGFCQKIKDNWMSIQQRRSFNSTGSPRSPPESTQSTPRSQVKQVKQGWRGGIKTRKTSHRKTKRSRTNKKSHSHKKRH